MLKNETERTAKETDALTRAVSEFEIGYLLAGIEETEHSTCGDEHLQLESFFSGKNSLSER